MTKVRFRKHDTIGAVAAEEDEEFLAHCFVDTGDLAVLMDCRDPRRLVVGRVGSGKSALLQHLCETADHAIIIPPESLAVGYVANSDILNFVSGLGADLDIFFRLLWRHVMTVELLRARFGDVNQSTKSGFIEWVTERFRSDKHTRALEYLTKWGKSFWEDTDYRIREVTRTLEEQIKSSLKTTGLPAGISLHGGQTFSQQEKAEIVKRAQNVINQVQIQELSTIIDLVADVLDDPQQNFFIVIDRLDENWVHEHVRYRLIRALIETAKDFHRVKHAKIIVALRHDLVDRVFRLTRDSGFQEEKYEGEFLPMRWTRDQLIAILDRRIDYLFRRQSTKGAKVTHRDILPRQIGKVSAVDYILERTLMRPRDVIMFFNACIATAMGKPEISVAVLREAERIYSPGRLRSLADEWASDYPNLLWVTDLLKVRQPVCEVRSVEPKTIEEFCLQGVINGFQHQDVISRGAEAVANGQMAAMTFWFEAVEMFYRVGLIGLKTEAFEKTLWFTEGRRSVSSADIRPDTKLFIHPTFWRVLGTTDRRLEKSGSATAD